jgi:cysteinyl-tRNA synthetase
VKIFNTLSGKKEHFEPIEKNNIRMYVCGMTVYDDTHIGHARTFLSFDLIVRYLRSIDYKVHYIRNITDVDDKIISRANELGMDPEELTERYINSMDDDFESLGMIKPDAEPRATENISSIISLIEILIEKGHAYEGESDVYFSTESFSSYGKLSRRNLDDMLAGARIDIDLDKKNPTDFVLWKKNTEGLKWDSPWGPGRPGWHIECSAMSMDALGETFDIHGGGSDLKFPHHENEIAQSECVTGKEFAKLWMHTGSLRIDKEKMSKSLNNFITIKDALHDYSSEVLRFFLISSHYRSPLNYSDEGLKEAKNSLDRLYNSLEGLQFLDKNFDKSKYSEKFHNAMQDDFNTPSAISILFDLVRQINAYKKKNETEKANSLASELVQLSGILGILQNSFEDYFTSGASLTNAEIENFIVKRNQARANKDFALSDKIRDELLEKGISLEDKESGTIWKKS